MGDIQDAFIQDHVIECNRNTVFADRLSYRRAVGRQVLLNAQKLGKVIGHRLDRCICHIFGRGQGSDGSRQAEDNCRGCCGCFSAPVNAPDGGAGEIFLPLFQLCRRHACAVIGFRVMIDLI